MHITRYQHQQPTALHG